MNIYLDIVIGAWAAFLVFWLVSALSTKRTVYRPWWRGQLLRIAVIVAILAIIRANKGRFSTIHWLTTNPWVAGTGAALAVVGVAFAIWARVHIGKNWGMPMSIKENPELVTSGPYALVRHPIYSGVMLMLLGSGLVSPWWLVIFAASIAYFIYSATHEEKLMVETFPDVYPSYQARTKMLIPFVL